LGSSLCKRAAGANILAYWSISLQATANSKQTTFVKAQVLMRAALMLGCISVLLRLINEISARSVRPG
jgi:hypothetical protein